MAEPHLGALCGIELPRPTDFNYGYKNAELPQIDSEEIIGIEVEVENVREVNLRKVKGVWTVHEDGSLRNSGREFVTVPIKAKLAPAALYHLLVTALDDACSFNMRTSVHVHLNVTDMPVASVVAMTALYTVFETGLFNFVGRGRSKSIFCVPLTQCNQLLGMTTADRRLGRHWEKYTAYNLRRASEIGTVEYRHMAGTFDVDKLCMWIGFITNLKTYVMKNGSGAVRKTVESLTRDSNYELLAREVFGENSDMLRLAVPSLYYRNAVEAKLAWYNASLSPVCLARPDSQLAMFRSSSI